MCSSDLFTTDRAPAAVADAAGDIMLFGKNQTTREVFLNNFAVQPAPAVPAPGDEQREWTGWQRPPGSPLTAQALSCCTHNRKVYAFAVQINGQIAHKFFMPNESENTVVPWAVVPGGATSLQTGTAVSSALVNGRLVLCAADRGGNVMLNELAPGGQIGRAHV
mgnify:CR=1 FL=1